MVLIADSGSTKTDWSLLHIVNPRVGSEVIATFQTQGITPIHQTPDVIRQILGQELMSQLSTFPRSQLVNTKALEIPLLSQIEVFFYGSGCTPAHVPMMKQMLGEVFSSGKIEVHSDLMAAARALCQHEPGIACILGTGANSCLYDFMNAIFKNPQFAALRDDYLQKTKLTQADIINKVYREPLANRFLATTSLYIQEHLDDPLLRNLVVQNFRQFFRCNIVPYQHNDLPVHFVGSMAHHYVEQLKQAADVEGYHLGHIMKSPMEGLVTYHSC